MKTCELVRALGIRYTTITSLLRYGRLQPPPKDGSGDYVWAAADVDRLRLALAQSTGRGRPRKEVTHAN
jgi:hypothetical protein